MAARTGIQWADHTWSPWRGCQKVSAGCQHCYAEALAKRNPAVLGEWGPNGKRVVNKDWDAPRRWDRAAAKAGERRRVFPSLCDWLERRSELDELRGRFLDLIADTPNLDWLLLTKRPEAGLHRCVVYMDSNDGRNGQRLRPHDGGILPNLFFGVSVEDQETADARIPALLETPAAMRWVSYEPALGPVDFGDALYPEHCPDADPWGPGTDYPGIDWVVVGGESGPDARPFDAAWARKTIEDCDEAGVPCFVKQLGRRPFDSRARISIDGPGSHAVALDLRDPKGGDPTEWPPDLRVRQMPASPAERSGS